MTFAGAFPYGGSQGAVDPADMDGSTILIGAGAGVDFYMVIDPPFVVRSIVSFTGVGRVLAAGGSGSIPVSGGGVASIILSSKGVPIDAGMSTLNFMPGSDNSFLITDTPAGQGNVSLNYAGLAGLFGSVYQPARSDHKHITGGIIDAIRVMAYGSVAVSTGLSTVATLSGLGPGLNGVRYDILGLWMCIGGVTTGDQIDAYISVAGAASVKGSGTQTANGERGLFAYNSNQNILGDGVTTYNIIGKAQILTSGLGSVQAGLVIGLMIPRS